MPRPYTARVTAWPGRKWRRVHSGGTRSSIWARTSLITPMRKVPPLGNATGAGGNAPKLLLTEGNQGELYLDGVLADDLAARHWLVKFPRN